MRERSTVSTHLGIAISIAALPRHVKRVERLKFRLLARLRRAGSTTRTALRAVRKRFSVRHSTTTRSSAELLHGQRLAAQERPVSSVVAQADAHREQAGALLLGLALEP